MKISDIITVLKVRNKSYVLFYAGLKRGQTMYDVIAPDGSTICTSVCYDDAVEASQLHYVQITPPPGRTKRIKVKKVHLGSIKKLERNNDVQSDKTHLGDYNEWSLEYNESFNLNQYCKRFL